MQMKAPKKKPPHFKIPKYCKLTEKKVKKIREEYMWRTVTMDHLAKKYGVTTPAIWGVVNHVYWKHVK